MSDVPQAVTRPAPKQIPQGAFLFAYYALAVIWGVRSSFSHQPSLSGLLFPLAMATVLAWWVVSDSIARGRPIPLSSRKWFFILAGLLVPDYWLWSRGWRGAGLLVLHVFLWYVLCWGVVVVSRLLMSVPATAS